LKIIVCAIFSTQGRDSTQQDVVDVVEWVEWEEWEGVIVVAAGDAVAEEVAGALGTSKLCYWSKGFFGGDLQNHPLP
jgi:hypothetical protein